MWHKALWTRRHMLTYTCQKTIERWVFFRKKSLIAPLCARVNNVHFLMRGDLVQGKFLRHLLSSVLNATRWNHHKAVDAIKDRRRRSKEGRAAHCNATVAHNRIKMSKKKSTRGTSQNFVNIRPKGPVVKMFHLWFYWPFLLTGTSLSQSSQCVCTRERNLAPDLGNHW